jgi:RNA polymerase sigma-70 factor (ECF subfamily)
MEWVMEPIYSWMKRFRRLLARWDKNPANYLALLHFACVFDSCNLLHTRSERSTQSMYNLSGKYLAHGPTTQLTFTQLIRNARECDKEALAMLYHQAFPLVYHYVLVRLGNPDLTEDVVSEVFLEMIEAIRNLRTEQEAGFYAWLFQITQRKISKALKQLIRRRSKHLPLVDMLIEEDDCLAVELVATDLASDPTASYELRETLEETKNALDNLNEEQRVVITGRFLAGQRIEELAQALGKRPGAVRILQFRALKILAQRLGGVHKSRYKRDKSNTVTR